MVVKGTLHGALVAPAIITGVCLYVIIMVVDRGWAGGVDDVTEGSTHNV